MSDDLRKLAEAATQGHWRATADVAEKGVCCRHASDCAVHNEPAYPAGECDCGVDGKKEETTNEQA